MLIPPGPGAPPGVRAALQSYYEALADLQAPGRPQAVFAVAQAGLPPAADHPRTLALVSDLNILAHSDGIHWIRQDTGAVIV
jgi:hypothetical protein